MKTPISNNFRRLVAVLFIIIGVVTLVWLLFPVFKYYEESDALFRPFRADVWGTVSDWVLVGVTALTAVVIWRTLESQRIVQQDQAEVMRIQFENRKRTIVPRLKIKDIQFSLPNTCYIIMYLDNASLIDMEIYIDCFDQQERTVYKDITKCPTIPVEKEFPISFDFDPRGYSLSLDMTFKDVDGSPYSQVFGIHIHANGRYRIFINDGITDLSLEKNLQHG